MIEQLRPYPEVNGSGLAWLGDVPAHWDVPRNGRLFGPRQETGFPDLPVLEVSLRSGVRIRDFENGTRKQEMSDRSKHQRARGDIAYNMMRMWQGAVGIAPVDGLASPAYVVARPFAEVDAAYYAYLFRTGAYMREIDIFSRGIVPDRNRLFWVSFKQISSVYPPHDEQRRIVRFLNWHGAQTAKLICAKKKIIALLNEEKQAIIHRAVTRGVDLNAKLSPSGIPWLGDVPEGWEVRPILACYKEKNTKNTGMSESTVLSFRYGRIIVKSQEKHRGLVPQSFEAYQIVDPGNIIVRCTDLQNDQKTLRVGIAIERGIITSAYMCLQTIGTMSPEFGYQILNNYDSVKIIYGYGSNLRQNLNFSDIRRMPVPLPPPEEQAAVVSFLHKAADVATRAIEHMGNEIALIQEFRTHLIADVVTGKLDVRAVAANLPEVVERVSIDDLVDDDDLDVLIDPADSEEAAA